MKIYTTVEPVPSRMLALTRLLLATGPILEEDFIPLLQPRENTGMAEKTLDAAIECGLVTREKRRCLIVPGLFPEDLKPNVLDDALPNVLAKLLLTPKLGQNTNGFAVLCAWLLHQPIANMPTDRGGLKGALEGQGLSLAELQVQSDARWDNVVYWARYLGLVRQLRDEPCAGLLPDPSDFLRRHLGTLLPAGEEVDVSTFRQKLGSVCPVLDGGSVRTTLLKSISPEWPERQLSEALSFAIERLEHAGELRAWCPDDQRSFLITPPPSARKIAYLERKR